MSYKVLEPEKSDVIPTTDGSTYTILEPEQEDLVVAPLTPKKVVHGRPETVGEAVATPGTGLFTSILDEIVNKFDTPEDKIAALFPRTNRASRTDEGNRVVSLGLDVASLPFRAAASGVGELATRAGTAYSNSQGAKGIYTPEFWSRISQIGKASDQEGIEGLAEEIARDPANILLGAGAPLSAASKALKASILVKPLGKAIPLVAENVASAGVHQSEHVSKGDKVSPTEAAMEVGAGLVVPELIKGAGKGLKKLGVTSMTATLKPSKALRAQGAGPLIEKAMEKGDFKGTLPNLHKNVEEQMAVLGSDLDGVIKDADALAMSQQSTKSMADPSSLEYRSAKTGGLIDLLDIFEQAQTKLDADKRLYPLRDRINNQFQIAFTNMANDYGKSVPGMMLPSEALQFKRAAGAQGAWVKSIDKRGTLNTSTDPDADAREIVYNAIYNATNKNLKDVTSKGYQDINKRFSELIPIEKAIYDAQGRVANREIIPKNPLEWFTTVPINMARSPVVATGAYDVGKVAEKAGGDLSEMSGIQNILRQLGRNVTNAEGTDREAIQNEVIQSVPFSFYNENITNTEQANDINRRRDELYRNTGRIYPDPVIEDMVEKYAKQKFGGK